MVNNRTINLTRCRFYNLHLFNFTEYSNFTVLWIHKPDHFGQGFYCSQAVITGSGGIIAFGFQVVEKGLD